MKQFDHFKVNFYGFLVSVYMLRVLEEHLKNHDFSLRLSKLDAKRKIRWTAWGICACSDGFSSYLETALTFSECC